VADDLYGEGSKVERETARTTYAELLEIWHAADADLPGKAEATTWLASNQRGG
jgi:hypothetical protein